MADEATCGWTRNGSVRFIQVLKFVKSFSWILRWLKFLECQAFCLSDGQSTKSCRVRHSLKSGFLQHVSMVLGITFWEGISVAQHHSKLQCKIYQHVLRHHPSAEGRPITLVLRPWWRGKNTSREVARQNISNRKVKWEMHQTKIWTK